MIYADSETHVASILSSSSAFKVVFIYHDSSNITTLETFANKYDASLLVSFCSVHVHAFGTEHSSNAQTEAVVIGRAPLVTSDSNDSPISHLVPTGYHIVHSVSGSVHEITRSLESVLP